MDEFNQTIQVFCSDLLVRRQSILALTHQLRSSKTGATTAGHACQTKRNTYRLILLIKIVDVAIQDFDKQFNRHRSVHASVGDAEGTLETFQHPFAVTIELQSSVMLRVGKDQL